MKPSLKWLPFVLWAFMLVGYVANLWQMVNLSKENGGLSAQLAAQRIITDTTLSAVTTYHRISGETIDAKRKNTLDAQATKKDIKVILVGNDCASAAAPADLINRMRQYKD
ncbi:MAG: hypothetical protein RR510_15230 [Morganella sp. (in: enterobacteria)]